MEIQTPFAFFRDTDGTPLDGGYIYIGVENQEPITNPVNVYWDEARTILAAQPLRTLGGYPVHAGAPANVYVGSNYSITVKNKSGELVVSLLRATSIEANLADSTSALRNAGMVAYDPSLPYEVGSVGHALASIPSAYVTYAADQAQTYRAFTSTGTAPAFVLTPTPALTAYTVGKRFRWKIHANGTTGSNTGNISGLGAINFKQRDATGALVDGVLKTGQLADVEVAYDGSVYYLEILNPLPSSGGGSEYVDFNASCTGASAAITMTAARVTLRNASGSSVELSNVSETLTITNTGAGGMDKSDSLAASTWYYTYFIYNPATGDVSSLASLSPTAPTLPSGYTHYRRMGAFRTDATANKYPLAGIQCDNVWQYTQTGNVSAYPPIASGNTTGVTECSVETCLPPTSSEICIVCYAAASGIVGVQPFANTQGRLGLAGASDGGTLWARMLLVTRSVYVEASGSATNYVGCTGWVDNGGPIYVEA